MRKLIYAINFSIDGCCDHTKMTVPDEEVYQHYIDLMRGADVLVYGRKTYQLMVPFWPDVAKNHSAPQKAMNDFADAFDAVGKIVVFSQSLNKAEEEKTSVVNTGLRDEILRLKQQPGKYILTGGVDIPAQLTQMGLVDEFDFIMQPTLVGEGKRLLDGAGLTERLQLKLVGSKVYGSGHVLLRYAKS